MTYRRRTFVRTLAAAAWRVSRFGRRRSGVGGGAGGARGHAGRDRARRVSSWASTRSCVPSADGATWRRGRTGIPRSGGPRDRPAPHRTRSSPPIPTCPRCSPPRTTRAGRFRPICRGSPSTTGCWRICRRHSRGSRPASTRTGPPRSRRGRPRTACAGSTGWARARTEATTVRARRGATSACTTITLPCTRSTSPISRVTGNFNAPEALAAMRGHILARGEAVGLYSTNPTVRNSLGVH